ncbi:hypothetical protein BCV72DRAFT_220706 [Rhizopus microsporus var. microsporus]|uniref:AD domain-containing protein n=2 Tax=Rhizopus microsporus TaxID=58291 RepID=A0A1X0RFV5_RHIZD|nr:hypothetical protein BCV72DRAFT_220706 [Rhizopus microsporus var. microsporus]
MDDRRKQIKTMNAAETLLGRQIKVKTVLNEQMEGSIYTLDKMTNCLVLDCSSSEGAKHSSFRIIKLSHIKEILSVEQEKKDYANIGYIHLDVVKNREMEAMRGFSEQVSKMGVGVSKEGQDIFYALSKTLPCRWSKDTIIVMDEVYITPPYGIEDCKSSHTTSLARVKKVLEGERKRLNIK